MPAMKSACIAAVAGCLAIASASATTITVSPVFEPLSLHDTDGDEAISDTGDALQACVMARPMAMTGALPEVLIDAIRTPHRFPTNNENYQVAEANLLVLSNIGIHAVDVEDVLVIHLDVSLMVIPRNVDLTARQILNLTIVAIRKTLEVYQIGQDEPLMVKLQVEGTTEMNAGLKELDAEFTIGEQANE